MTKSEKENWLINLRATADDVASEYGVETVTNALYRFGVSYVEDLSPSDYEEAFSELYLIATDK